jgi:proteasome lid subunit RPN8/RPN11
MNNAIALLLSLQMSFAGSACEATRRQMLPILRTLFEASRTAARDTERALFLTQAPGESLQATLWPATMERRRATYRGSMPANVVGIAHTHPQGMPRPSEHDLDESERTGLPIYVITRTSIARVDPDRTVASIVEQYDWLTAPKGSRDRCEAWT